MKFILHGLYDVQHGHAAVRPPNPPDDPPHAPGTNDKRLAPRHSTDETEKDKTRCMYQETFMLNITAPTDKRIDVRIEKTPPDSSMSEENVEHDEISSVFDEEINPDGDDDDENTQNIDLSSIDLSADANKLTLADVINKTLAKTTDAAGPTAAPRQPVETSNGVQLRKAFDEISSRRINEKVAHAAPIPLILQAPRLSKKAVDNEKLFRYLDYLEAKDEPHSGKSNQSQACVSDSVDRHGSGHSPCLFT